MRALLALALGAVALGACTCEGPPKASPLASVVSAAAPAHVERGGERIDAAAGASLFARDAVVTGPGGGAVIRFVDGTEISVEERTRFVIGGGGGELTLELQSGSIVSDARTAGGQLRVLTRYGAAEIVRGSEVQFTLSDEGGSMDVAFGEIRLLGGDGGARSILAGEELAFDLSGPVADAGSAVAEAVDAGAAEPLPAAPQLLAWRFAAPAGAATLRAPGDRRASPAAPEPSEVAPGTQFSVRPRRSAVLSNDALALELSARTRGEVGEAAREGELDRFALSLAEGEGILRLPGDRAREVTVRGAGRSARIEAREETVVRIRQTRSGLVVEPLAGKVSVAGGEGDAQPVAPGARAEVTAKGVARQDAPAPSVVVPHSRRVRIYASNLGPVGLAVPQAEVPPRVEVARDPSFDKPFLAGRAHGEVLAIDPPARGDVFWRALDGAGQVLARGHARFDRDTARAQLDNPRAEVAETGLKATVFFQSALPAITFSFTPHEAARRYAVRVYRAADLKTPLAEKTVEEARCAFEAGKFGEGDYLWHAAPLDANGAELAGGRMNRLEIVYDNSRTTLAIARPRIGERLTGATTPVEGVAPIGSRLYVNGKPAALDSKGRFSLAVRRSDAVVFRLVSDGGAESWWVRSSRRRQ